MSTHEIKIQIEPTNPSLPNLLGFDLSALQSFFKDLGEKPFRAKQMVQWIHQYFVTDVDQMTDLPKKLREKLSRETVIQPPEFCHEHISGDGTIKWLTRVAGGQNVETVFIPEQKRGTLCVSSQIGCALNCSFCSTATQGFNRDLQASEIIGQVWLAKKRIAELQSEGLELPRLSNVVMMGMGEPLLNYDHVSQALALMRDDLAYGLAKRRVTVSTSGVVPGILKLAASPTEIALALSLHAPNDELRDVLVPINRKYPLKVLMNACRQYLQAWPKQQITIEYIMIRGINDQIQQAKALIRLLQGFPCKVNLIPFNPYPGTSYERSDDETIQAFRMRLIRSGFITTVRATRGDDIDAACGQLVGQFADRTKRKQRFVKRLEQQAQQEAAS